MQLLENNKKEVTGNRSDLFTPESAGKAREYHRSFAEYAETPLVSLKNLAESMGVAGIYVKDESFRFGLNAFKVLGASYTIGKIADTVPEDAVFVTATDGNHGRGVAWTADRLKRKCIVYLPEGSAKERLDNILALGADAAILDLSYDECVDKARRDAEENGWILIQDTSDEEYDETEAGIMQGYTTMALEAAEQLRRTVPTHVFLQAGVGSMAASAAAFMKNMYGERCPKIIIVEPENAPCLYITAEAQDGEIHAYGGKLDTMMAGLACGVPCRLAWNILSGIADWFALIPDSTAAVGMRKLARPVGNDRPVVSGESGAAGFACALEILKDPDLRSKLEIGGDSVILCFSTEGDTDRENYIKVING